MNVNWLSCDFSRRQRNHQLFIILCSKSLERSRHRLCITHRNCSPKKIRLSFKLFSVLFDCKRRMYISRLVSVLPSRSKSFWWDMKRKFQNTNMWIYFRNNYLHTGFESFCPLLTCDWSESPVAEPKDAVQESSSLSDPVQFAEWVLRWFWCCYVAKL